jgi:hypothetical protein
VLGLLFGGDAARPLEQFQTLVGLAAFAGGLGFLSALGRFLARAALLWGDLPFFGVTFAPRGATRAILVGVGWSPVAGAGLVAASAIRGASECARRFILPSTFQPTREAGSAAPV